MRSLGTQNMNAISVQEVLSDLKKLSGRLRSSDVTAESLLAKANHLEKTVEAQKEYHSGLESLSASYGQPMALNNVHQSSIIGQPANQPQTHPGARSSLIASLQRESRQLQALERENRELRIALEDHQNTLELIMSKYRSQMSQLIKSNSVLATPNASRLINATVNVQSGPHQCNCNNISSSNHLIQMYQQKITEMAAVMMKAIDLDEANDARRMELIAELRTENKGLKELLFIAKANNQVTQGSNIITKVTQSRGVQTGIDEVEIDASSVPPLISTTALDSLSISSGSTSGGSQNHSPNELNRLSTV